MSGAWRPQRRLQGRPAYRLCGLPSPLTMWRVFVQVTFKDAEKKTEKTVECAAVSVSWAWPVHCSDAPCNALGRVLKPPKFM
jgi:hypothetical protein